MSNGPGRGGGGVVKVVVTGATGNVGTAVLRALARSARVDHVVGVARRVDDAVRDEYPWVEWHSLDVGRDDLDHVLHRADAVVHLAWQFHPTRRPIHTWEANVLGSIRTFDAAARAGVRALVHASSVGAYSPAPQPDVPVDEEWPTHALPTAAYGRQKSYVERVLDGFEASHPRLRVVRLRSAFVFQPSASPEQRRIFAGPFVPGRLLASGHLALVPVPRGLRFQTVHADDLAHAYVAALESDAAGAFNVAAAPVIDARELADVLGGRLVEVPARAAERALGAAYRLRLAPAEPGLLSLFLSLPVMDTTWARERLGWVPARSGVEALEAFLDGLRHPAGGATPPLRGRAGGPLRVGEVATGVGARG